MIGVSKKLGFHTFLEYRFSKFSRPEEAASLTEHRDI